MSDLPPANDTPLNETAMPASAGNALRGAEFARGMRLGIPILLGYAPVGAAFGVLARTVGFNWWQATLCSATALAGAGQFIALSVLSTGAGALTVLIATAVVNLRYVLFATTLAPGIPPTSRPGLVWLGFTLTDETFAVNIADLRGGQGSAASMAGAGFVSWVGWVAGTAVGALAADSIGDPTRFGVDFAMAAMFSALFVALAEDVRHVLVGLGAIALVLLLPLLRHIGVDLPGNWYVVVASMVAATGASVVLKDE